MSMWPQYPAPRVHADWKWRGTDPTQRELRNMTRAEYDEWYDHLTKLMQQAQERPE